MFLSANLHNLFLTGVGGWGGAATYSFYWRYMYIGAEYNKQDIMFDVTSSMASLLGGISLWGGLLS